jgi:hypothetical protein
VSAAAARSLLAAAVLLAMAGAASAQPAEVGEATMVVRSVYGTVETLRRRLAATEAVYWQELIETEAESAAKVLFVDGSTLTTGPNSTVRIDEFVYAGADPVNRVVVGITRGLLRFVTGSSPSDAYTIRTPSAMIGVRGTDFAVSVEEDGQTRVHVLHGQVTMTALSGFRVVVREGQASRTGSDRAAPPAEPGPPDPDIVAAATEVTALMAIAGDGNRAAAVAEEDVETVRARQLEAAQARGRTAASQTGPNCTGC